MGYDFAGPEHRCTRADAQHRGARHRTDLLELDERLAAAVKGNFACYELWAKRDPGATACFYAAVHEFEREQGVLAAAIHAARAPLQGGCSQLATAALVATHRLALDLRRVAPAAASPDRGALLAALALGIDDENNLDLTGQLDRFGVLCSR